MQKYKVTGHSNASGKHLTMTIEATDKEQAAIKMARTLFNSAVYLYDRVKCLINNGDSVTYEETVICSAEFNILNKKK